MWCVTVDLVNFSHLSITSFIVSWTWHILGVFTVGLCSLRVVPNHKSQSSHTGTLAAHMLLMAVVGFAWQWDDMEGKRRGSSFGELLLGRLYFAEWAWSCRVCCLLQDSCEWTMSSWTLTLDLREKKTPLTFGCLLLLSSFYRIVIVSQQICLMLSFCWMFSKKHRRKHFGCDSTQHSLSNTVTYA